MCFLLRYCVNLHSRCGMLRCCIVSDNRPIKAFWTTSMCVIHSPVHEHLLILGWNTRETPPLSSGSQMPSRTSSIASSPSVPLQPNCHDMCATPRQQVFATQKKNQHRSANCRCAVPRRGTGWKFSCLLCDLKPLQEPRAMHFPCFPGFCTAVFQSEGVARLHSQQAYLSDKKQEW